MQKKKIKKLILKKEIITVLSNEDLGTVKGGILSIGHNCSVRNSCDRLITKLETSCPNPQTVLTGPGACNNIL